MVKQRADLLLKKAHKRHTRSLNFVHHQTHTLSRLCESPYKNLCVCVCGSVCCTVPQTFLLVFAGWFCDRSFHPLRPAKFAARTAACIVEMLDSNNYFTALGIFVAVFCILLSFHQVQKPRKLIDLTKYVARDPKRSPTRSEEVLRS